MLQGVGVGNALRNSLRRAAGKQYEREENSHKKTTPAHEAETSFKL
jgi:hypothetical protein